MVDLAKLVAHPEDSIREVIARIDGNAKGVALVVDSEMRLIDMVTDGDLRRAVLARLDIELPVQALLDQKKARGHESPVTMPATAPMADVLHLMNERVLRHVPLLDEEGRVVDLAYVADLVKEYELPLTAVVMAGGLGTRLRPLTNNIPKPMLPIGDEPLLAHTIKQLRQAGIRRLNLAMHYKGEVISNHFGDGSDFGVEIEYVREDQPLGTAGALRLVDEPDQPLLVVNGDILTNIDFRAMLNFHREYKADMTVGVRLHEVVVPYGVVETDGVHVRAIVEKPVVRQFINAGVYLLNPGVCALIPEAQRYDMPELISTLVGKGRTVVCFPIREYWLDIGQLEDYRKAVADVANGQV